MYSNARTDQNGSVAVFLVVSVLLAAAVIGGVYFVHQRGDQARGTQPIAQAPGSTQTNKQPEVKPQDAQPADDQAKKQEEARKQAEAAKQAEEAKKKADQEAAAKKQQEEQAAKDKAAQEQAAKEQAQKQQAAQSAPAQTPTPQTGPSAPAQTAPANPSHLPTTGPADTLVQLLGGGVLIALVGTYLRSYRHRFGSLLR